jgi:hypothetical protein
MMTRKYDALLPHTRPLKHLYTHWATRALSCVKRVAALLASSQEGQCCFFWQNLSTPLFLFLESHPAVAPPAG